jgi:hypothetical protein
MKKPQYLKSVKIYAYITPIDKIKLDEAISLSGESASEFIAEAVKKALRAKSPKGK